MNATMKHIWQCLEGSRSCTPAGRVFEAFIIVLILLNTAAVIVGSVQTVESEFGRTLRGFEVVSMVIFTLEYLGPRGQTNIASLILMSRSGSDKFAQSFPNAVHTLSLP